LDENRGDRAELRRCRSPAEVAFVPAFYRLRVRAPENLDPERLAVVAGILSHLTAY
jgi:CRISPR system Cascade subunit CasB